MIGESIGLFFIGSGYLGLSADIQALNTFGFEIMIYFAIFSLFVVRERRHFWNSRPSWTLLGVLLLDAIIAAILATFGVFGMKPIPFSITLIAFFPQVTNRVSLPISRCKWFILDFSSDEGVF